MLVATFSDDHDTLLCAMARANYANTLVRAIVVHLFSSSVVRTLSVISVFASLHRFVLSVWRSSSSAFSLVIFDVNVAAVFSIT